MGGSTLVSVSKGNVALLERFYYGHSGSNPRLGRRRVHGNLGRFCDSRGYATCRCEGSGSPTCRPRSGSPTGASCASTEGEARLRKGVPVTKKERDYKKYNPECDTPVSAPVLVHLDKETGAIMQGPGEGVESYCATARVMWGLGAEGGIIAKGSIKVSVSSAYQRQPPKKAGATGRPCWHWIPGNLPTFGYAPVGSWVVGSAVKRFPAGASGKALFSSIGPVLDTLDLAACQAAFEAQVVAVVTANPELMTKLPRAKAA